MVVTITVNITGVDPAPTEEEIRHAVEGGFSNDFFYLRGSRVDITKVEIAQEAGHEG